MEYNRVALKQTAKDILHQAQPRPWSVTLIYLLITGVISGAASILFAHLSGPYLELLDRFARYSGTVPTHVLLSQMEQLSAFTGQFLLFALVVGLIFTLFSYGYNAYSLALWHREQAGVGSLFAGFRMFLRVISVSFFTLLFLFLWVLLACVVLSVAIAIIAAALGEAAVIILTIFLVLCLYVFLFWLLLRYAMAPYWIIADRKCGGLEAISRSKRCMRGNKGRLIGLYLSFIGWLLPMLLIAFVCVTISMQLEVYLRLSPAASAAVLAVLSTVLTLPLNLKLAPYLNVTAMGFFDTVAAMNRAANPPYHGPTHYDAVPPVLSSDRPPQPPQTGSTYVPKPPEEPGLSGSNDPWNLN